MTLGLCRFLSFCAEYAIDAWAWETKTMRPRERRPATPVLVLLRSGQRSFTLAALSAGAHRCLVLPIQPQDVVIALAHTVVTNGQG